MRGVSRLLQLDFICADRPLHSDHLRLIQPVTHSCHIAMMTAELHPARQEDMVMCSHVKLRTDLNAKHYAHIISLIYVDEEAPFDPICFVDMRNA